MLFVYSIFNLTLFTKAVTTTLRAAVSWSPCTYICEWRWHTLWTTVQHSVLKVGRGVQTVLTQSYMFETKEKSNKCREKLTPIRQAFDFHQRFQQYNVANLSKGEPAFVWRRWAKAETVNTNYGHATVRATKEKLLVGCQTGFAKGRMTAYFPRSFVFTLYALFCTTTAFVHVSATLRLKASVANPFTIIP